MEYKHIIYKSGKVAHIILNRPQYRNAQSVIMREEMDNAFAAASRDEEVGCIVLSGNGTNFSAGHDTGTKEEAQDPRSYLNQEYGYNSYDHIRSFCMENSMRWRNIIKPTIAMVHGYCIFGGWTFAAAMDLIFASEDALFLPSQKETFSYAERVADRWLANPLGMRNIKFSINHMMDQMGYSAEIEVAYQSFFINSEVAGKSRSRDDRGHLADVTSAMKNLELEKPWLERFLGKR